MMDASSSYEAIVDLLGGTYLEVLGRCFGQGARLEWLALGREQETFYFNYALDPAGEAGGRKGSSVLSLRDWLSPEQQSRLDAGVSRFAALPAPEGADQEEWFEDRRAFVRYALRLGLGEVALGLQEHPERLAVQPATAPLRVGVFDDIECSTFEAKVPELDVSFSGEPEEPERRSQMVAAFARTERARQLLLDLWDGHHLNQPLVEVLARQRSSRQVLMADIQAAKGAGP